MVPAIYENGTQYAAKYRLKKLFHSTGSNPGHLYTKEIGLGEFTVFTYVHGDLGSHQSYACKIGGNYEDDIRSLIEMVYPTATYSVQVNYNYAHFPYMHAKPTLVLSLVPSLADSGKWIGVKIIHKITPDRK